MNWVKHSFSLWVSLIKKIHQNAIEKKNISDWKWVRGLGWVVVENITIWISNILEIGGNFQVLGEWFEGRVSVFCSFLFVNIINLWPLTTQQAGRFHMMNKLCFFLYFQFKLHLKPLYGPNFLAQFSSQV